MKRYHKTLIVSCQNTDVVPHGVPTDTVSMEQADAKAEFGYSADDTVIVEPGYVRPEKGYDTFLTLAKLLPEYEFLIGGGSPNGRSNDYVTDLESRAPDNVQITGLLDDDRFHAVFNAADLIVLPYDEVTQSGIFNWCVAYELPVAGSNEQYFQDVSTKHGCVALFDQTNLEDIVEVVHAALGADRQRTLKDRMRDYRETRTMDVIARTHVDMYEEQ